jgi:hypothetical protein
MPATLSAMLRSVMKAKRAASSSEQRFLREIARLVSASRNGRASMTAASGRPLRRTLKCPRCSRRFARPVHLGRHLSATHGRRMKAA